MASPGHKPIFRGGAVPEGPPADDVSLPAPAAGWVRPRGRPPVLVTVLADLAPWLLERTGDGGPGQPFHQAGEARPTYWTAADKERLAYGLAARLAARCRRMAQQDGVTLIAAARYIAEATFCDAERARVPGYQHIPPDGTAQRRERREALAKAIASMARPDRSPAEHAAVGMGATKARPGTDAREARHGAGMTKARPAMSAAAVASRDAARAAALQVTRDAIAATAAAAKAAAARPAKQPGPGRKDAAGDQPTTGAVGAMPKVAR